MCVSACEACLRMLCYYSTWSEHFNFKNSIAGQAFTIMLVYVWARRNPFVRMNFFGLVTFQAPYLPWVLLGFSLLIGNSVSVDLVSQWASH